MAGQALSQFNDFVEATGSAYVTGPKSLINAASKNTYCFSELMQGEKKLVRGGQDIKENTFFKDNGSFHFYQPGETEAFGNPQRLQTIKTYWRFAIAHMQWTRQEILLNEGVKSGGDSMFHQFSDIRNEKEALMWTSKWNGLESALWAEPNTATMETETGKQPYSIPCFINENPSGLFEDDPSGSTWSTVHGIDPTAASVDGQFQPQVQRFASAAAGNEDNVLAAFDDMFQAVEFRAPAMHSQYFSDPAYSQQMIKTTKEGRAHLMFLHREGQDRFVAMAGNQDPAQPDPQFHGIPIRRASELETATLYQNSGGTDNVTEGDAGGEARGPRYYWINAKYLYPTFHDEVFFLKDPIRQNFPDVDTYVMPCLTWFNLICTDRRHQGIVSASGTSEFNHLYA